ncbi:MAG: Fur family transcriptional regulator [Actinomycetaceae bacterium]|nr:Fur family transcriptional regulator [Actinomycetaceae bacterium]MDY6143465.1 Fur family transcriptional regulator [Arcanobacterium sp.]
MNQDFRDQLRKAGLRATKPRLAVLEELQMHPHASADVVRRAVTERLGAVSTQAIYDVLHTLTDKGLLHSVEPAGSVALYELSSNDNHHHLVCRNCAKVVDIPCAIGEAPCFSPDDDHGFLIDEAEVIFWGICPECAAQ